MAARAVVRPRQKALQGPERTIGTGIAAGIERIETRRKEGTGKESETETETRSGIVTGRRTGTGVATSESGRSARNGGMSASAPGATAALQHTARTAGVGSRETAKTAKCRAASSFHLHPARCQHQQGQRQNQASSQATGWQRLNLGPCRQCVTRYRPQAHACAALTGRAWLQNPCLCWIRSTCRCACASSPAGCRCNPRSAVHFSKLPCLTCTSLALPCCPQPLSLEELLKKKKKLEEEASKVRCTLEGAADICSTQTRLLGSWAESWRV